MFLKRVIFIVLLGCCVFRPDVYAQPNPHFKLKGSNFVQSKNYYLLTLLQINPAVRALIAKDPVLAKLTAAKLDALRASFTCKDVACFMDQVKFSADEIKQVGDELAKLYHPGNALDRMIKTELIPSGMYILNKGLSNQQFLVKAWEQDADGINHTISVYAGGQKPNYPNIDSISFKVKSKGYLPILRDQAIIAAGEYKNGKLFFEPAMAYALHSLEINGRNDAANYEPLTSTLNKAAILKIKQTNWHKYKYSLIMIPGVGPEEVGVALSGEGMQHCRIGALSYFAGMAPFVMVTGGMVHPYRTPYCEAVEMKKYLINTLHVPASAIICEPQARHTTTNIRNGIRLIYHYGIPFNKPFLISTGTYQSSFISKMATRCEKELKYVPYKLGNRLSETTQEFYPVIESLQVNQLEPLDP